MASKEHISEKSASVSCGFAELFLRKLQESLDRKNQNLCTRIYIKELEPVYAYEISCMMHTLGDVAQPLPKSVEYLEAILRDQMNLLLIEASAVPNAKVLSHAQLLTLLVNNREKMIRLLHYLFLKDSSELLGKKKYDQFFDIMACRERHYKEPHVGHRGCVERLGSLIFPTNWAAVELTAIENAVSSSQFGVRVKTCLEFLATINVGDYDPETITTGSDDVALERIARRFQMSRKMTDDQYLEFSKKQRICFYPKGDGGKFKKWLLADKVTFLQPTPIALDILSFFARETVAEVVEISLLMSRPKPRKRLESNIPGSPSKNNSRSKTDQAEAATDFDINIPSSLSGMLGLKDIIADESGTSSNIDSLVNSGSLGMADLFALSTTSLDEKGVVSPAEESPCRMKRKLDAMGSDAECSHETSEQGENENAQESTCGSNLQEPKIPARDADDPIIVEDLKTALLNSVLSSPGKLHMRKKKKILCL